MTTGRNQTTIKAILNGDMMIIAADGRQTHIIEGYVGRDDKCKLTRINYKGVVFVSFTGASQLIEDVLSRTNCHLLVSQPTTLFEIGNIMSQIINAIAKSNDIIGFMLGGCILSNQPLELYKLFKKENEFCVLEAGQCFGLGCGVEHLTHLNPRELEEMRMTKTQSEIEGWVFDDLIEAAKNTWATGGIIFLVTILKDGTVNLVRRVPDDPGNCESTYGPPLPW